MDVFCDDRKKKKKKKKEGPNYKEPRTVNFSKTLTEVTTTLDTCIEALTLKIKYTTSNFKPWKEKVLAKVKENITKLKKQKIKLKQIKQY